MCDYSLETQRSRDARTGERLRVTAFAGATTVGFAAADEPEVAVCLKPGTELAFPQAARFTGLFSFLLQASQHDCLTARFRHVNVDNPRLHHDALEFGNGQIVLLTHLSPGQDAVVLQLPAELNRARTEVAAP